MGQIKLSSYIKEIEKEFESGQYTQVIAHCRQILKQYPRYIVAYRFIGMALMEQQAYVEAEDIFQRVLSLDISDFVSHKGLAEIMAETGRIEQAIWHIEHSFEIDPNHADVIHLREQYYRRAGVSAPVVNGMPLASVARLYVKSGIYDQAIEELNRMLDHNQDRLDWKAILAVAYWRDGRNAEALQLGETVLEILPNNYQARMILGDIWWQNERQDIASPHLDILQQTLLLDQDEKESFPIVGQVLEQTERIPLTYMVESLGDSEIDDWSSRSWESNAAPSYDDAAVDETDLVEAEADDSFLESDFFETDLNTDDQDSAEVSSEISSSFEADDISEVDAENALDDLFESLDDDPSLVDSDLLSTDADWEENRLGTGLLDSFAADIESFSDEEAESLDAVDSDESFGWLGADDDDDLFQSADKPDPISDSELNQLPDIATLFDDDFEASLESESQIEDTLIDEIPAIAIGTDDQSLNHSETVDNTFDFADEDKIEDLFDADLSTTGALLPLPDEDDIDAFEWPDPDQDATETDLKALFDDPNSDSLELESDGEVGDDQTGFTGWLEDEDLSTENEPSQIDSNLDDYDPSADALAGGLFEFLSDKENQLNPLPPQTESFDTLDDDFEELLAEDFLQDESSESTLELASSEVVEAPKDGKDINDLFDTSWLDAEPSEEIDLLQDSNDDLDLKSFADSLEGGFEFFNSDDESEDSKFKPQDDFDSLFDSPSEPPSDLVETTSDQTLSDNSDEDLDFLDEFDILAKDGTSEFDWISDEEESPASFNDDNDEDLALSDAVTDQDSEEIQMLEGLESNEPEDFSDDLLVEDLSFLDGVLDLSDEETLEPVSDEFDFEQDSGNSSFLDDLPDFSDENADVEELASSGDLSFLDAIADSDEIVPDSHLDNDNAPTFDESNISESDEDINLDVQPSNDENQYKEEVDSESSEIDWLIPEQESSDDLSWLSLLEDATASKEGSDAEELEDEAIWTSDLSAAANPILSPNFDSEENSTEDPQNESSPDWLIEFPEYNDVNLQTGRLEDEPFHDTGRFTGKIVPDIGQPHETESRVSEVQEENVEEQEFDPVIFRESTAIKLPDWLSDTTETASLGFEPDPELDAELDVFAEASQPDKVLETKAVEADVENTDHASDSALLFPEDDPDMERDKDGNPIPPESQDLEDTLNWLEELAIIDVHGEEPKVDASAQTLDLGQDVDKDLIDEEPISDIFSGGSSLHAFADLEDVGGTADPLAAADDTDTADVSEETLTWLDDLFTPTDEPASEFPTSTWDASNELLDLDDHSETEADDSLDVDLFGSNEAEPDTDAEPDTKLEEKIDDALASAPTESEKPTPSMFGDDDIHISEEEISKAAEFGDAVPGMEDLPDDPDALMAWLDLDSTPDLAIEAQPDDDQSEALLLDTEEVETIAEVEPVQNKPAKKAPSMFGEDDIHISEEEISQAAEFGDAVPGMEDMPDDPDALMAWLNLDATEEVESSALSDISSEVDQLEALPSQLEEAKTIVEVEPEPSEPVKKAPSMFGEDDIHISEDEISRAAEFGDAVPGMEDMPDDPDALMAWLNLDVTEEVESSIASDISSEVDQLEAPLLDTDVAEAPVESEPAKKAPSMFGEDDIHISEEEISQAVEFGDAVPGMEDMPDDPEALMAWLNLAPDELDDDSDFSDSVQTSEADLIVADLGEDAQELEPASLDTPVPTAGTDELDDLFDELAGSVEGDVSAEDLIFGDLGTGRLSGTDWLDRMTFDSDPALLGDVPTIPPHLAPSPSNAEDTEVESLDSVDINDESIENLEELPDDPDEFLKILESNVTDTVPDIAEDHSINLESGESDSREETTVPDWLQIEPENADSNLGWLDDASPSGVFNWLEAEEGIGTGDVVSAENGHQVEQPDQKVETTSIFDSDPAPVPSENELTSPAQNFKAMLDSGDNIPDVIRQIRSQLEVKNDSTLQKLLGDAYMETGQLQDALDAYRQAQRLL